MLGKRRKKVTDVEKTEESYEVAAQGRSFLKPVNCVLAGAIIIVCASIVYTGAKDYMSEADWKIKTKNDKENQTSGNADTEEIAQVADTSKTESYVGRGSLGGSFVDDHNQELFISKKSETSAVDKGATYSSGSSKSGNTTKASGLSNTTNTSSITVVEPLNDTEPDHDIYNDPFAPEYNNPYSDPNYNPDYGYTPGIPDYTPENPGGGDVVEPLPPIVEPTYDGYVMRKLNFSEDGFWWSFYFSGDQIIVNSDDLSMMDESMMDPNNSNIFGLSKSNTRPGWVYVRDNNADDQFLDSCDNLDAQINAQISEQKRIREEADRELTVDVEGEILHITY